MQFKLILKSQSAGLKEPHKESFAGLEVLSKGSLEIHCKPF